MKFGAVIGMAELKGATPDILQRLIPEHVRKQNPTLAL
jgi:glycogen synthase kinase 3 beta